MVTLVDVTSVTGLLLVMAALMLGRTVAIAAEDQAREVIATYRHEFLVATVEQFEHLAQAQVANPLPLTALNSGLILTDDGIAEGLIDRAQSWSAPI